MPACCHFIVISFSALPRIVPFRTNGETKNDRMDQVGGRSRGGGVDRKRQKNEDEDERDERERESAAPSSVTVEKNYKWFAPLHLDESQIILRRGVLRLAHRLRIHPRCGAS